MTIKTKEFEAGMRVVIDNPVGSKHAVINEGLLVYLSKPVMEDGGVSCDSKFGILPEGTKLTLIEPPRSYRGSGRMIRFHADGINEELITWYGELKWKVSKIEED